jgi:hypothetical protein
MDARCDGATDGNVAPTLGGPLKFACFALGTAVGAGAEVARVSGIGVGALGAQSATISIFSKRAGSTEAALSWRSYAS